MDSPLRAPSPSPVTVPSRSATTSFPSREDCWSEDATFTLIDAWGDRYLQLNRGNLRQQHWQEVAGAVNSVHGRVKKAGRTDVQCKNRIDTLKKKYKIEKARVSESNGSYISPWPFFTRLDALIGDTFPAKKPSPPVKSGQRNRTHPISFPWITTPVPVGPRSGTQKRPSQALDNSYFRRNFSAFAAARAEAENAVDDQSDGSRSSMGRRRKPERPVGVDKERESEFDYRELAKAIERFGDIYQRIEASKQKQILELEKQRMQFAKDLEYQRMQLFMETQVQLLKIKRTKRSARAGEKLSLQASTSVH